MSLSDYTHPFAHCMTKVVPGMKDKPTDTKAFCAALVHRQTGHWPGEKSEENAAANEAVLKLTPADGDQFLSDNPHFKQAADATASSGTKST